MNSLQVYQLIRFSTTLLIGVLLVKIIGLATAEIALYEVVLFIGNFLSFFWISAGQKGLLTLYPTYTHQVQEKLLFNLFLLMMGLSSLVAILIWGMGDVLLQQLTQYTEIPFLYLIGWYSLFNAPAQLIEYIYVLKKQDRLLVQYGGSIHLLQLLAIIYPIWMGWGVPGIFQGLVLWSFLKFLWLLVLLQKYSDFSFDPSLLKKIGVLLIPLCLHTLLGGGMEYIDGFLVTHFFDADQFAIFRYGARELPFVNLLVAAFAATMIPLAVEQEESAIHQIKQHTRQLSYWMYPLTILLMLLSPVLFPIVYSEDFLPSAQIFNIYLLIIGSRILLPQVFLYSHQQTHILVYSAIIEVIINTSLSLYLLRDYGLQGIAFATVIAYLINKIILIVFVWNKLGIPLKSYLDWRVYVLFNLALWLVFIVFGQ